MKIIDISVDGTSFIVEGDPLDMLQLQDAVIVDNESGEERGKLEGFYLLGGESIMDGLLRAIPPGCHLLIR
jgi:hypothetical protein